MTEQNPDCLSCRLIGGFGFIGIGLYIFLQGRKLQGINNIGITAIGSTFGLIGAARLLNIWPFNLESNAGTVQSTSSSPGNK